MRRVALAFDQPVKNAAKEFRRLGIGVCHRSSVSGGFLGSLLSGNRRSDLWQVHARNVKSDRRCAAGSVGEHYDAQIFRGKAHVERPETADSAAVSEVACLAHLSYLPAKAVVGRLAIRELARSKRFVPRRLLQKLRFGDGD